MTGPQATDEEPAEPERGIIEIVHLPPESEEAGETEEGDPPARADLDEGSLFEREAHPREVILAIIAEEDAGDFVATLEAQGVGARLGETTEDEGVEILIHELNLADAQAILVEFTGDPSLVDDIGDADSGDPLERVATGVVGDLGAQAQRLSAAGIDVRMEVPGPDGDGGDMGALLVDREDLDEARRILGIVI